MERQRIRCWTCRSRRLTCDAAQPSCRRCHNDGVECNGYGAKKPLRFLAPGTVTRNSLVRMKNKKVQQSEMLKMFLKTYASHWIVGSRGSFLSRLTMDDLTPLQRCTFNALCFAHVAVKEDDKRLLYEARASYNTTLQLLNRSIMNTAHGGGAESATSVISSIMLIGIYAETTGSQANPDALNYKAYELHYRGAQHYLKARGPAAFDMTDRFQVEMLQNLWLLAWCITFTQRKPLILDQHEWHRFNMPFIFAGTILENWQENLLPLPGLLGELDDLLADKHESPAQRKRLFSAVQRLDEIRRKTFDWTKKNVSTTKIPVSDWPTFNMEIEEHVFMSTNDTIPFQYQFGTMEVAVFAALSWCVCLIADCFILRVQDRIAFDGGMDYEQDGWDRCMDIVQCIHCLSQLDDYGIRGICADIEGYAIHFFADYGAVQEMGWCEAIKVATTMRSNRIESVGGQILNPGLGDARNGALASYRKTPKVLLQYALPAPPPGLEDCPAG